MADPKYSIAIPVYNRGQYLRQALVSCISQTEQDFEVIVSDDCSEEDLAGIVAEFGDPRLRHERSAERLRAAKNHQRAVGLCGGKYVIVLHSDDMLLPNCLTVAGGELDRQEKAAAIYFTCTYLHGSQIKGFHPVPRLAFADRCVLAENKWLEDFHGTGPSCALFRREIFARIGGYRTDLRFAYDWDLYRRLLEDGGGVAFLPRILSLYRFHQGQAVQNENLAGLLDVLDLWISDARYQFRSGDVAGLVLKHCLTPLRAGHGLAEAQTIWKEISGRSLAGRVLRGMPAALMNKMWHRLSPANGMLDPNYVMPANQADAIASALAMRARMQRSGGAA